jgi:hypothetical protein
MDGHLHSVQVLHNNTHGLSKINFMTDFSHEDQHVEFVGASEEEGSNDDMHEQHTNLTDEEELSSYRVQLQLGPSRSSSSLNLHSSSLESINEVNKESENGPVFKYVIWTAQSIFMKLWNRF